MCQRIQNKLCGCAELNIVVGSSLARFVVFVVNIPICWVLNNMPLYVTRTCAWHKWAGTLFSQTCVFQVAICLCSIDMFVALGSAHLRVALCSGGFIHYMLIHARDWGKGGTPVKPLPKGTLGERVWVKRAEDLDGSWPKGRRIYINYVSNGRAYAIVWMHMH